MYEGALEFSTDLFDESGGPVHECQRLDLDIGEAHSMLEGLYHLDHHQHHKLASLSSQYFEKHRLAIDHAFVQTKRQQRATRV